jgi:tetratricopeptide (TPR) repeat protein
MEYLLLYFTEDHLELWSVDRNDRLVPVKYQSGNRLPLNFMISGDKILMDDHARESYRKKVDGSYGDFWVNIGDETKTYNRFGTSHNCDTLLHYALKETVLPDVLKSHFQGKKLSEFQQEKRTLVLYDPFVAEEQREIINKGFFEVGGFSPDAITIVDFWELFRRAAKVDNTSFLFLQAALGNIYIHLLGSKQPFHVSKMVIEGKGRDPRLDTILDYIADYAIAKGSLIQHSKIKNEVVYDGEIVLGLLPNGLVIHTIKNDNIGINPLKLNFHKSEVEGKLNNKQSLNHLQNEFDNFRRSNNAETLPIFLFGNVINQNAFVEFFNSTYARVSTQSTNLISDLFSEGFSQLNTVKAIDGKDYVKEVGATSEKSDKSTHKSTSPTSFQISDISDKLNVSDESDNTEADKENLKNDKGSSVTSKQDFVKISSEEQKKGKNPPSPPPPPPPPPQKLNIETPPKPKVKSSDTGADSDRENGTKPATPRQKSSKTAVFIAVAVLIIMALYIVSNSIDPIEGSAEIIDENSSSGNKLPESMIFDPVLIQNHIATEAQKELSLSLIEQAKSEFNRGDYTSAISTLKESIMNSPTGVAFVLLSDAYYESYDFERSKKALDLAYDLDYQPKAEIDQREMALNAAIGNYGSVTAYVNKRIALDKNFVSVIQKDPKLYSYRQTADYIYLIQKDVVFDNSSEYFYNIVSFYDELSRNTLDANVYFSDDVVNYVTMKNTNPNTINAEIYNVNSDYSNSSYTILGDGVFVTANDKREVWIKFRTFRSSKNSYQECRIKAEFVFDLFGKIKSYRELAIEDLKFLE